MTTLLEERVRQDFGEDALRHYKDHYSGLTRGRLFRENRGLYQRLWRDGLLEHIPKADFRAVQLQRSPFGDDPVAYYKKHYKGLTRGLLKMKHPGLYDRLRRDGLLKHVPLAQAEHTDFGDNPVAYYKKHYKGLTRGRLTRKHPGLYKRLRLDGLLKYVPTVR